MTSLLKRSKNKPRSPSLKKDEGIAQSNNDIRKAARLNDDSSTASVRHLLPASKTSNSSYRKALSPQPQSDSNSSYLPKIVNNNNNNTNTKTSSPPDLDRYVNYANQEEFSKAMYEAKICENYDDIKCFLKRVYTSYSSLPEVVQVSSKEKDPSLNINLEYLDYFHESIVRAPQDVQKVVLRTIIGTMLQDNKKSCTVNELRAFPILLLNPLFNDNATYGIYAHILRQIAVLKNTEHLYLISWFKRLPKDQFTSILERIKTLINFKLLPSKKLEQDGDRQYVKFGAPWWIPQGVKVLALLNASNEQTNPLIVPRKQFYISGVDYLDLAKEYQTWQTGAQGFSFCQYPFLLGLSAKRLILEKDSETKMLIEARQTLVKKVQKREAPNMGMLFLNLNIRRNFILEDSLKEISIKQQDLKKKLRVMFSGEPGIDLGGVSKEWFVLLIQKLFNPDYGMFKQDEKTHTWWFNASCKDSYQEYNLCGVLIGLAMYNGINLDIRFPQCLYKKLLNPAIVPYDNPHAPVGIVHMTMNDFKEVYPVLAKGLQYLLEYDGDVEEDLCQCFQVSFSEFDRVLTRNLKPNGKDVPVTNKNRAEYVQLYIDYLLNKCIYQQFYSFYHGFHSVCASNALLLLRPEEVQTLVIGDPDFKLCELERIATYDGYTRSDNTVRYFWDIANELTPDMQRKLLFFCTGSDRIPVGGMKEMRFKITRVTGHNATQMLPMAHTCFNQLCLPAYKTRKSMHKKLLVAINNAEGFGIE